MKSWIAVALLLMLIATSTVATTVHGKVVGPDGAAYADVEITVQATKEVLYTDGEGEFYVENLEPGEHTLTLKTGRSTTTHKINVLEKTVTEVTISVK